MKNELLKAAKKGDIDSMRLILEMKGIDINCQTI